MTDNGINHYLDTIEPIYTDRLKNNLQTFIKK